MAIYHSKGRFTPEPDLEASLFHLHKAADHHSSAALFELGCIYRQLPHYELDCLHMEVCCIHSSCHFKLQCIRKLQIMQIWGLNS